MTDKLPDLRPVPEPDASSAFFWEGAKEGRLLVQRCSKCSCYQYPPEVVCLNCQSSDLVPTEVSGRGSLYSYAVVERPFHAGFVDVLPYIVALVDLPEQDGLRMLTNIVDATADELSIGMPLEVVFEDRGEVVVPQFRPTGASS